MSDVIIFDRMQQRRGTLANLEAVNEVLLEGEFCVVLDTGQMKIGDGVTAWNLLPYFNTDNVPEGSTNLYFTVETAYLAAKAMLLAGSNVTVTADDDAKTLTVAATGGGGGGGGAWTLLDEQTVTGAAATSISLTGLDLSAYRSFRLEFSLKNATAGAVTFGVYFNGDTTATNYYRQGVAAVGSVISAVPGNDGLIVGISANSNVVGGFDIANDVDGRPVMSGVLQYGDISAPSHRSMSRTWVTAANLTQIDIVAAVASALAIGSTVRLYGIGGSGSSGGGGYGEGTFFPSTPSLNEKFYRTDLNLLCYYDGAQWLTVQEYSAEMGMILLTFTITTGFIRAVLRNDFTPFVTKVQCLTRVSSGTNNATNYWQIDVQAQYTSGGVIVTENIIASTDVTTKTEAINVYTNHLLDVQAAVPVGTTNFYAQANKVGSPGPFVGAVSVYYRLIVT